MNASVLNGPRKSEFISDRDWVKPRRSPYRSLGRTHSDVTLGDSPAESNPSESLLMLLDDCAPLPKAVEQTCRKVFKLVDLEDNWDSYGALPVQDRCIVTALEIIFGFFDESTPAPSVVPTSAGGVQLEWHRSGADLEIEVTEQDAVSICFEDENEDAEFSIDLKQCQEQCQEAFKLAQMLERISR